MELDRVRVEYFDTIVSNQKKFGFRFYKNRDSCELTTKYEEVFEGFKNKLQSLCIQTDFNHKYQIEKLIGKGSFGRVH